MDVSLDGKVALVTGAGPNIGSGIALALARYGAKVACNDLDLEASKAAVRRISRNGGEGLALSGDVSVEADVLANIAAVLDAWGRIDIVVNNAAWLHTNHILEEDLASFNRAITIAVNGNFLFTKHAALAMIERDIRGSHRLDPVLERVAGRLGLHRLRHAQGRPGQLRPRRRDGPGALRDPGQQLHPDRAAAGQPGAAGPVARGGPHRAAAAVAPRCRERPSWWRPTGTYDVRGNIPMGEPATPTDIGHCIAWLSSDYARLITGCDFVVDGGARAKYWAYTPDAGAAAGPVPLIPLDVSSEAC